MGRVDPAMFALQVVGTIVGVLVFFWGLGSQVVKIWGTLQVHQKQLEQTAENFLEIRALIANESKRNDEQDKHLSSQDVTMARMDEKLSSIIKSHEALNNNIVTILDRMPRHMGERFNEK